MAFAILLLYLVLTFLRPQEFFLELQPLRLMLAIGLLGLLATGAYVPMTRSSLRTPQLLLAVVFLVALCLSMIFGVGWFGGSVFAAQDFGPTLALFYMVAVAADTPKRVRVVTGMVAFLSLVLVAQGALAFYYGINAEQLVLQQTIGQDEAGANVTTPRMRSVGFLNDPNDLAQMLVVSLPLVALAWRKGAGLRNLLLVVAPSIFLLWGVKLTQSRGAVVSLFVLMVLVLQRRMGRMAALASGGVIAFALASFMIVGRAMSNDASASGRIEAWSVGIQLLKSHPLFGVGYGAFTEYNELTAHNSFVLAFAELGMFGYAIWLAMLITSILQLRAVAAGGGAAADARVPLPAPAPVRATAAHSGSVKLAAPAVYTPPVRPPLALPPELVRCARAILLALYTFLAAGFFLSRSYATSLYILIGLACACIGIARQHDPQLGALPLSKLAVYVAVAEVTTIVAIYVLVKVDRLF